jgi:predicted AAA+ superfamily ATPase
MTDPKTIERETGNLLKIKDNHPKYIISMDEFPPSNYSGIIQLNIREFLMMGI